MAARKRRDPADAWLLKGRGRSSRSSGGEDLKAQTRQWLAVPQPKSPNGAADGARPAPTGANGERTPRRRLRTTRTSPVSPRERKLAAKLKRAQQQLEAQAEEIKQLREQVRALEAEAGARPASRSKPTAKKRSRGAARPRSARKADARLDVNQATFEQLRELELSVTQSARLIAYREARGGFGSLDELDEVPGMSKRSLAQLRANISVSSR